MDRYEGSIFSTYEGVLKDEYPAFLKTLENEMYRGVRFHPLKLTREQFIRLFPYELKPTLFCAESFYVEAEERGSEIIRCMREAASIYRNRVLRRQSAFLMYRRMIGYWIYVRHRAVKAHKLPQSWHTAAY